jgi:predicted dinucleotide-binding enzyme
MGTDPIYAARRRFLLGAALLAVLPLAGRAAEGPFRIGTIGAGRIGGTLGGLWAKAGHPVMFSSRHPEELRDLVNSLGPLAQAGTVEEAIAFAEVVLLAVPYRALPQIGKDYAGALAAKALVIDACNPFPGRDGQIATWAREKGAGLATAELLPGARLVRAFNAIGAGRLPELSHRKSERVGMPIAGDDSKAIAIASGLIREIGFEPVLIGPLAMGRHLVPGTPLAGEHSPEEIRSIAATLN